MENQKNINQEIQPFNEVFYIESLFAKTHTILSELQFVNEIWDNANLDIDENHEMILNIFQNMIINVAGISRFFWPSRNEGFYNNRAEKLREVYNIGNLSPLKNRQMRNLIEHFDENLDDFLNKYGAKNIIPSYVGNKPLRNENTIFFRAYFSDKTIFKVLNKEYKLIPIIDEINRIHQILLIQREKGGRFII